VADGAKMTYITREHAKLALSDMKKFNIELQSLYAKNGLSMTKDLGRRNMMMSQPQERFFANALATSFSGVKNDGKTGAADILIGELDKELECKLTSPYKSGTVVFQTDYATLQKKKKLDYLYVIADKTFENFIAVHYTGLEVSDFAKPHASGRGKASMLKHIAVPKRRVIWGNIHDKNEIRLKELNVKLDNCSQRAVKTRENLLKQIEYWKTTPTKFVYEFEAA
jgi:hypothetical protein